MTLLAAAGLPLQEPSCYSRLVNDWICGQYLTDRQDQLVSATTQHLWITAVAVAAGLAIAFPMALLARRQPRLESTILGVSTGLYTIPSLALFPLLVPFTGLTATTVIVGLALYALTVLVRAFLEGLQSVPDDVRATLPSWSGITPGESLRWRLPGASNGLDMLASSLLDQPGHSALRDRDRLFFLG